MAASRSGPGGVSRSFRSMAAEGQEYPAEKVVAGQNPNPTNVEEKRKAHDAERGRSRIYLYEQIVPWRELKSNLSFHTDKQLAEFLITRYLSGRNNVEKSDAETQTDFPVSSNPDISNPLEESPILPMEPRMMSTPIIKEPTRKRRLLSESTISAFTLSRSDDQDDERTQMLLCDPEDLEQVDSSDDGSEFGVEEQQTLSINVDELNKTFPEEEVFDMPLGEELEMEDPDLDEGTPQSSSVFAATPPNPTYLQLVQMEKCIVFTDKILELLQTLHGTDCNRPNCCKDWDYQKTYVGSCLVVTWKCSSGHRGGSWSSQPIINRMRAGNLLLSACLLLSGNSFTKVALFFKFLNLKFISKSLFYQHQGLYIAPVVQNYWDIMRESLLNEIGGKEVLLSSDGRNDSPGHCAQYCTYTIADMVDEVILQQNVLDVREVEGRKSVNMERLGFELGMDALLSNGLMIKEIVTDGHTGIASLMSHSEKYSNILHQRDVWHGGKNIGKKVTNVAQEKGNGDLVHWVGAIKNHFWYCSRHCEGNVDDFKDLWRGVLHHVVNEHEWVLDDGINLGKCDHDPLNENDRDKPWLEKNSKAHKALQQIVLSKRLLNTFPYYTNFRHTGFLESFHNHMLMYCPKRHSYSYVGYKLRNQVAIIDFNSHRKREPCRNSDGAIMHRAQYSKRTKQWRAVAVLKAKEYKYIPSMIEKMFEEQEKSGSVNQRIRRSEDDPRKIAPNIAIVPRPSIQHLLAVHKSRF